MHINKLMHLCARETSLMHVTLKICCFVPTTILCLFVMLNKCWIHIQVIPLVSVLTRVLYLMCVGHEYITHTKLSMLHKRRMKNPIFKCYPSTISCFFDALSSNFYDL